MNICAIIMGVETRIGINFHMISARHTRCQPANSNVELVRARQIELCWAFPEHCQPQRTKSGNVNRAEGEDTFWAAAAFEPTSSSFPHNREYLHNINFYVPSRYLPEYASFLRLDTVRASLCEWSALFPPSSQRQRR